MSVNDITNDMIMQHCQSYQTRTCVRLMIARATGPERAVDPKDVLYPYELHNLESTILQGYVEKLHGVVYLTTRGKLIANRYLQEIFKDVFWK